ncbi:TPA: hypothetical protein DIS56_02470 [Candidatus Saccharibacteria bacterium]|nr:hypothetical protein [Candidatus Saccharibacteria bacterium]
MVKKLSDNFVYWEFHESIAFADIRLSGLPETITVKGNELPRKTEFHITLIDLERIAKLINQNAAKKIQTEIIDEVQNFLKTDKLDKFKLLNKFRFVQRDSRKSVIVMCRLPGADRFFSLLRKKYETDLPLQPFHITLYALPKDKGIGLLSDEEVEEFSVPVESPELKNIKPA